VPGYLTLILCCQLIGEVIARLAGLPIPGPVIGMVVLFCGLVVRGGTPKGLEEAGGLLLRNLPLLFVPAGVGVIAHMEILRRSWAAITGAIIIGTVLTIAVTGLVMQLLNRQQAKKAKAGQP
jgi:holin-like protein